MKIILILIGLVCCGCASQPVELTQAERDLKFFYEEPKVEYEILGRVDTTSPGKNAMDQGLTRPSATVTTRKS